MELGLDPSDVDAIVDVYDRHLVNLLVLAFSELA
jgi:hypothetical protein